MGSATLNQRYEGIERRERMFDERLKENGRLIRQLHAAAMQQLEQVNQKYSRSKIRREGNVIYFVPSYAVKGGK